jgi:dTMP kinase
VAKRTVRGRFITFEGGEGAGKSTQIRLLAARLDAMGIPSIQTREPGGSPGAEAIREVILENRYPLDPLAEILLFSAARADHVRHTIRPELARGRWVLCDRFVDSTRAYQGAGRTVEPATIRRLEAIAIGSTRPDLTLVLDVEPAIGLARAARRRGQNGAATDRFEHEALEFHARVRAEFLAIAAASPQRHAVIPAGGDPEQTAALIWAEAVRRIPAAAKGAR